MPRLLAHSHTYYCVGKVNVKMRPNLYVQKTMKQSKYPDFSSKTVFVRDLLGGNNQVSPAK